MARRNNLWVWIALAILFVLHNDLWLWNDPTLVFGLPVGLTYHLGYCLAAAIVFGLIVRFVDFGDDDEGMTR